MTTEQVVHVDGNATLAHAMTSAFTQVRTDTRMAIFVFPAAFRPAADLVEHVVAGARLRPALESIVLAHPSAAMGFVASSISLRIPALQIRSVRSPSDISPSSQGVMRAASLPDTTSDAFGSTLGRAMVVHMRVDEDAELFVRRAFLDLRERAARRAVLVFARTAQVDTSTAEQIAKELAQSHGVRALGLVHPSVSLDVNSAAIALRQPRVRVVTARDPRTAERALEQD
jgi:hypothetical protein